MSDRQDVIISAVRANSDSMETEFSGMTIKSITLTDYTSAKSDLRIQSPKNKGAVSRSETALLCYLYTIGDLNSKARPITYSRKRRTD